jgi:Mrp family chromosome partitioning ATPase
LKVITAGKHASSPGDLLESKACEELIAELRASHDLVVFDVPPALAVADTEGFASKLDAVVLLCRSRKLTRAVIARTAERLRGAGANLIGAVLNADRPNRMEGGYGYGYGYGYGE